MKKFRIPKVTAWITLASLLSGFTPLAGDAPSDLRPLGMGLGGFDYWASSPFANTMLTATDWLAFGPGEWGSKVYYEGNPQFDANGYPLYLNGDEKLRTLMWPFHAKHSDEGNQSLPARTGTGVGKWVVTWEGRADIRLDTGSLIASDSSGSATGLLEDGRRAYQVGPGNSLGHLVVHAVDSNNPVRDIKVWLPDPQDPENASLEGQFWHPVFLANLEDLPLNHLRFMDWSSTNQSPQRDWSDRRLPSHRHQHGILNRRSPAPDVARRTDSDGNPVFFDGDRPTGIAWEHIVGLANRTGLDPWICLPHLASDDYVRKVAQLFRYGSDGVNPYTSPQANPVYPPLDPGLQVWVEYSNEIWSNGNSFPQGNWAQAQADAAGISKPEFNARRASEIWRIFQEVEGGTAGIVRAAGVWTARSAYTDPFLAELADYGPTLTPAVSPDVIAPTTYFGNGIQDWAYQKALSQRGSEDPWFFTTENFSRNGNEYPISVPEEADYWTGDSIDRHIEATFREWKQRIFSGASFEGAGPDATGTGGGFPEALPATIEAMFGERLPLVSYEGGPSLYTDNYDRGGSEDDGITHFMAALNRHPGFAEIYRIQLNLGRDKGLDTHGIFVDVSRWGKHGQWGHLEFPDQDPDSSVKWQAVRDWALGAGALNPVSEPVGTAPVFQTPGDLPGAVYNQAYSAEIVVSGGDYSDGPKMTIIGSDLPAGLRLESVAGDPMRWRLFGAPQRGGPGYLYLRVADADGDADWRIFSVFTRGGPGTLVDAEFSGPFDAAASLPADDADVLDERLSWSGFDIGAPYAPSGGTATGNDGMGVSLQNGTDSLRFFVVQGGSEQADATLASAIADNEYWTFTLSPEEGALDLRGAEVVLRWIRFSFHAPRAVSAFSSISGFQESDALFTTANFPPADQPSELRFRLPESSAYADVSVPVTFRFYFHGSQYFGKDTGILGIKVTERLRPESYAAWAAKRNWRGLSNSPDGDGNYNGLTNFFEYAMDLSGTERAREGGMPELRSATLGDSGATVYDLLYRVRQSTEGPLFHIEVSSDLKEWSPLQADGSTVWHEIVDADPDGDGSAELHRMRVLSEESVRFFRFVESNP